MHIDEMFPSRWLRAADLAGDVVATIVDVSPQEVAEGERKPVVTFREQALRPLVLNKVNAHSIAQALGSGDTTRWIGKRITLYASTTLYGGKKVDCIRIHDRAPQRGDQHQAPPPPHRAPGNGQHQHHWPLADDGHDPNWHEGRH
jgi:hypothetical protein